MNISNKLRVNLLWITLFSVAMGFLECAVVVYLRAIYFPGGFEFPMVPISDAHIPTELGRELATLVMLIGIGILAGKDAWSRFAIFIYSFAIWDIFYYIFLKVLLNWPESIMTWDILFLIPTVWTGPVLAPVVSSVTMIFLTLIILLKGSDMKAGGWTIGLLITGAVIQIISYTWDFSIFLHKHDSMEALFNLFKFSEISFSYIPKHFPWGIFITGEILILFSTWLIFSGKELFKKV